MSKRISVKLTKEERGYYSNLFEIANNNNINNRVEGKDGAQFFKKSGLSKEVLKNIWLMAAQTNLSWLERDEFYVGLRLIALTQNNMPADEKSIVYNNPLPPLPKFDLKSETKPEQPSKSDFNQDPTMNPDNKLSNNNDPTNIKVLNEGKIELDDLTEKMLKFLKIFESYKDSNNLINSNTALKAFESLNMNKFNLSRLVEVVQINPNQTGFIRPQFIIVMTLLTIGIDSKNNDIISEIYSKLFQLRFTLIELAKYYVEKREIIEMFKEILELIFFCEKKYNEIIQNTKQNFNQQDNQANNNINSNFNHQQAQNTNNHMNYGGVNIQQSVIIPEINNNFVEIKTIDENKQLFNANEKLVPNNNTTTSNYNNINYPDTTKQNMMDNNNFKQKELIPNSNIYNFLENDINKHKENLDTVSNSIANNVEKEILSKQNEIKYLQNFLFSSNEQLVDLKNVLEAIQKQNSDLDNNILNLRNEIIKLENKKKEIIKNISKEVNLTQKKQAEVHYLESKTIIILKKN
jgi:hypothetical protein